MSKWIKRNWFLIVVLVVVLYSTRNTLGVSQIFPSLKTESNTMMTLDSAASGGMGVASTKMMVSRDYAPTASADRIVIKNSSLSLQVKDVSQTITAIETTARELGGYLVNSNLSRPDTAASGSISIRVPEEKRTEALDRFKKMSVKVVSESIYGNDVTDQYVDLDAQMELLNKTKEKYQSILDKATRVEDLLNVQQQLTSLQQQIDSIKGQQKYLDQSAKLTLVTIYLSTDDLALPYAPSNEWRPAVVFKEAVRSLISSIRGVGNLLIWGIVYLPILLPIGLVVWYLQKRSQK